MKKITFILFALITGTAFGQNSAQGTATVNAEIVSPIQLNSSQPLNFGSIVSTTDGGTVTMDPKTGKRTYSQTGMEVLSSSFSVAEFNVTIQENYTYSVSIPNISLSGPDNSTMELNFTHSLDPTSNMSSGNTSDRFTVGGELQVNGGQTVGSYTGTVEVTVTYE